MQPFTQLTAPACLMASANIDTDQLIPARFMKEPRSVGYGQFLLHDVRYRADGRTDPSCPLNAPSAETAEIMVAGRNFGAGSSREAAVYALVDCGFRCVVAPSFGDIFSANAVNNGLLPAQVSDADYERLQTGMGAEFAVLNIDLEQQTIQVGDLEVPFQIGGPWKTRLLNGWDDIDLTRQYQGEIERFLARYSSQYPWTILRPRNADNVIARN